MLAHGSEQETDLNKKHIKNKFKIFAIISAQQQTFKKLRKCKLYYIKKKNLEISHHT